jgi:hypothetical protein
MMLAEARSFFTGVPPEVCLETYWLKLERFNPNFLA